MEFPKHMSSREELVQFIRALREDFLAHQDEWENLTLESYLESLAASIEDMDGLYKNRNEEMPKNIPWKIIGEILISGKYYE